MRENKRCNLRLAAATIAGRPVWPSEIFSFWHWIGPPTARRGFKAGRNIVGGQLREEAGGGLCQMTTLLYHLALLAGLVVRERYAHTFDLYWDEPRFTPLGSDATVVCGFKYLRFCNSLSQPVRFGFSLEADCFIGWLETPEIVEPGRLRFDCTEKGDLRLVLTLAVSAAGEQVLATSHYR